MIVCMEAKKLNEKFPTLVLVVWNMGHIVTCFNDPMHGNNIKAASSLKTWRFNAILMNLTILTTFSIPWRVDEACSVYWGYPWTNSWIHFLLSQPHFEAKCEKATHTPKSGKMESSGTSKNSEDDLRGQISSPWCVPYINGKLLKCRCSKWVRIAHLNICSSSYGQKKGQKSNCQFDSRPLKVGNRPLPDVALRSATWRWKDFNESYNFGWELVLIQVQGEELWPSKVPGLQPRIVSGL